MKNTIRNRQFRTMTAAIVPMLAIAAQGVPAWAQDSKASLETLIISGGPTPQSNQFSIESNVRYVSSLLPKGSPRTILFTSGKKEDKNVLAERIGPEMPPEMRALRAIYGLDPENRIPFFRESVLTQIDGPAQNASIEKAFTSLAAPSANPVFLYFTGHGSPDRGDKTNNQFDLWNKERLTVQDLSRQIARIPENRPITLVMVQCYSASFASVLFEGGKPGGRYLDRPLAGFFSTTRDRVAAGCTPEQNEEDYHDFTSYFFSALTGRTRLGKTIKKPDYNKDGRTGMDEAYLSSIENSTSADVPMATSDLFLREYAPFEVEEFAGTPFETILKSGSAGQRAVLENLSGQINDRSPQRHRNALERLGRENTEPARRPTPLPEELQKLRTRLESIPGLKERPQTRAFRRATRTALETLKQELKQNPEVVKLADSVLEKEKQAAKDARSRADINTLSLRLLVLSRSVYSEAQLRKSGNKERIAQFDRLKKREAEGLF